MGVVGQGFLVLQELLRFQMPVLQEWLDRVVKVVDPSQSLAWKRFLREEPEAGFETSDTLSLSMSRGRHHISTEKLVPIEESETEYDCEDEM